MDARNTPPGKRGDIEKSSLASQASTLLDPGGVMEQFGNDHQHGRRYCFCQTAQTGTAEPRESHTCFSLITNVPVTARKATGGSSSPRSNQRLRDALDALDAGVFV